MIRTELTEFDRPDDRQPFSVSVIHPAARIRRRVPEALDEFCPLEFDSAGGFMLAVDSGDIEGPGVAFVDIASLDIVLKFLRTLPLNLTVVVLSGDEASHRAIAAVRTRDRVAEWIDTRGMLSGFFGVEAARRAYCKAYDRTDDLQLATPMGRPVEISEALALRIRALPRLQKTVLMMLCRGTHRDIVAYKLGMDHVATITAHKSRIVSSLNCDSFAEATRIYIAATRRKSR